MVLGLAVAYVYLTLKYIYQFGKRYDDLKNKYRRKERLEGTTQESESRLRRSYRRISTKNKGYVEGLVNSNERNYSIQSDLDDVMSLDTPMGKPVRKSSMQIIQDDLNYIPQTPKYEIDGSDSVMP